MMNFTSVTKMMLNSMDFFELRRTAARYGVTYQGVRRQQLVKDLERAIIAKKAQIKQDEISAGHVVETLAAKSPEAATSAKPKLPEKGFDGMRINTFSTRSILPRPRV